MEHRLFFFVNINRQSDPDKWVRLSEIVSFHDTIFGVRVICKGGHKFTGTLKSKLLMKVIAKTANTELNTISVD
jgi:hypothetical protein